MTCARPLEPDIVEDDNINELSRLIRLEFRSSAGLQSEAASRFRPGIFKKGLVLVLLPLLFSSSMILCLSQLNQNATNFLDVKLKQSKIAVAINRLMISMVAHMAVVGNYQMYGVEKTGDLQIPVTEMSGKFARELIALVGDDPQAVCDVNDLIELDRRESVRLEKEKPVVTDQKVRQASPFTAGKGSTAGGAGSSECSSEKRALRFHSCRAIRMYGNGKNQANTLGRGAPEVAFGEDIRPEAIPATSMN